MRKKECDEKKTIFLNICEVCGYTFSSLRYLKTHMRTKHEENNVMKENVFLIKCKVYGYSFSSQRNLKTYIRTKHE